MNGRGVGALTATGRRWKGEGKRKGRGGEKEMREEPDLPIKNRFFAMFLCQVFSSSM